MDVGILLGFPVLWNGAAIAPFQQQI